MNDLISRSALLDDLVSYRNIWCCAGGKDDMDNMIDIVQGKETVDAEPVQWEQIPGFEGLYEINNLAQIRNAKGDVLKQQIRREKYTCYKVVHLWKDGRYHHKGVHRLMAETFLPNPKELPIVNHKDEDGTNNLLSNLEWCDRSYNASYGSAPKKISKAFKGKESEKRIPVQQIKDGVVIKEYACAGDAEKETGISMANIRLVCRGKRKSAGGYTWAYCPNCGAKMIDGDENAAD
jgi:hypothetical protein